MTFAEYYFTVFDAQTGDIKVCGRDACKALMNACLQVSPSGNFGDMSSGRLNILEVKRLAKSLGIIDKADC